MPEFPFCTIFSVLDIAGYHGVERMFFDNGYSHSGSDKVVGQK